MLHEPLKVLIAEPASDARRPLLASLAAAAVHLDLHSVTDTARALEALGNRGYDCALIDAQDAPDEGIGFLNELRAIGIDTPVIVIGESIRPTEAADLLNAGAADCVARSELSPARLSCSLVNAVRRHRTEQRLAQAERNLAMKVAQDPLTRLPNRALFFERLERAVALAHRHGKQIALLMLNLNGFKKVNQGLGYATGDRLLAEAADRLRGTLRGPESLARIGDDEFTILLPPGSSLTGATSAANKLLEAMSQPFAIDGRDFSVGLAIGIALHPLHGTTPEELMRAAEIAMRAAKRSSTGFMVYSGDDGEQGSEQLALANDLRQAIDGNEFELYFQPKIAMQTRRICGVEVLLRWRHRRRGMVYPDIFIPLAEQIGVIEPMTNWVLGRALEQCSQWRRQGRDLSVSVNLSALTLHNRDFPATVRGLLDRWQVSPDRLVLEITESAIILDATRAGETLDALHQMGVTLSIDDFGTGYTSLAYIRKLPVSELKVDKSYVMNMRQNADDAVIVRTIIELAHNLDLRVVAEGVEDSETFDMLAGLGCDTAQGYYMGRPADIATLSNWLGSSPFGLATAA
jgi:diguanylate cyclase (GGDEF)-like protein